MSTPIERNILTIIEPEIMLDPLEMPDAESGTDNMETEGALKTPPSKFSGGLN